MADTLKPDPLSTLGTLLADHGVTHRELDEALRDVRSALEGGQKATSLFNATHRDLSLLETIVSRLPLAVAGVTSPEVPFDSTVTARTVVNIRTSPLLNADPLAPAWSRGLHPSATRGPFVNELGERFWIDTFLLPALVTISAQTGPFNIQRMIARVPLGRGVIATARRRLGSGTVWLPAQILVHGRPTNEFVGVRIRGGSLQLDGITASSSSTITLGGSWRFVMRLQLAAPSNPTPAEGSGSDAAHAVVNLPATMTLTLDASGKMTVELDNSNATVYGTAFALNRNAGAPFYDALSRAVVVPCSASEPSFDFAIVRSSSWNIGRSAPIARSGWALPVTVSTPQALGEAAGAGSLWLEFGAPLQASWTGLAQPAALPKTILSAAPGIITIWATVNAAEINQRLLLWDEPGSDPLRQSSIDLTSAAGSTVLYISQPGAESVLFAGKVIGHLDRPLQVDGGRVAVRMPAAWFGLLDLPTGITGIVLGNDPAASAAPHIAFALENSLLKVRPPAWLYASGALSENQLTQGLLLLRFAHRSLLPTLPDPYATNFEFNRQQDVDIGWTTASVNWPAPPAASLSFSVQIGQSSPLDNNQDQAPVARGALLQSRGGAQRVLLDVSSNADQFGVAIPLQAPSVNVQGMSLVAQAREVAVVTLPPISWEPMFTKAPEPGSGDVPLPPPPHDGGPAALTADIPEVRPVEPIPLLQTYHDAINKHHHFTARLPLPFGLVAQVQTQREEKPGNESGFIPGGGAVFFNQPGFDVGLAGGRQLAIKGQPSPGDKPNPPVIFTDPTLPGYVDTPDSNYAMGVLSTNIFTRFDSDFGSASPNGVPLRRYDLSGYGASLLSDWHDTAAPGPAIIEARFDVLVGRTAHEVIQMQSILYPWFIRVVRTITIDRRPGGWVLREDSGWVATTHGFFDYQPAIAEAFPLPRRHPGAIIGVENVRNIQLNGAQFGIPVVSPQTTWQAVTFDADVLFNEMANPRLASAGGAISGRTPSRGITGWIQIDGPKYNDVLPNGKTIQRVRPANALELYNLLFITGPAMAPIGCVLALGGTAGEPGIVFRAVRGDVSAVNDSGTYHLVAAVRGSPNLPRDGAWSLARRAKTDAAPSSLDPTFPVPLVRPYVSLPGANRWHLADPGDITHLDDAADPAMRYGFVQSLGTQKVFFERPRAGNDPDPITMPQPPKLADMGALLNAAGIFPGLGDAFDFQTLKALSVTGGDIGFSETFTIGSVAAKKEAVLADLGGADAIKVVIQYHDENDQPTQASIQVNPAGPLRWQLSLTRACFAVQFKGNPLISIFATVKADERSAPTVVDLRVRYEGILNALQTIFSNIQQVARFLPGGGGAGLHVGFSQGRLSVRNDFALPNLPLGAGQITDIAVAMDFDVALTPFDIRFVAGLGSSEKPFRWVVSPLAGTGVVQVGIGKNGLDVLVQGGLGLGLAIDLGIASGSASITLAVELNTGPDPFEVRGVLSGRASVDVLRGLASATVTLAAGLGIIPPPQLFAPPFMPPQLLPPPAEIPSLTIGLTASVSVGIHLTVCWVVDVDFDGYWQFRQDITTPAIPIPL
jgi:hypothetical protein